MFDKLESVEERFLEVEKLLSDPEVYKDREMYLKYSQDHSDLNKFVTVFRSYKKRVKGIKESKELLKDADPEIKELAKEELERLRFERDTLEEELKNLLVPKDPLDDKNVLTGTTRSSIVSIEHFSQILS